MSDKLVAIKYVGVDNGLQYGNLSLQKGDVFTSCSEVTGVARMPEKDLHHFLNSVLKALFEPIYAKPKPAAKPAKATSKLEDNKE